MTMAWWVIWTIAFVAVINTFYKLGYAQGKLDEREGKTHVYRS